LRKGWWIPPHPNIVPCHRAWKGRFAKSDSQNWHKRFFPDCSLIVARVDMYWPFVGICIYIYIYKYICIHIHRYISTGEGQVGLMPVAPVSANWGSPYAGWKKSKVCFYLCIWRCWWWWWWWRW
jgi:hypothetical protein